jgi:hypothetical protein
VVYQLVDEHGKVVYIGMAATPSHAMDRLAFHSRDKAGKFKGMQIIASGLNHHEARTLEGYEIRRRHEQVPGHWKTSVEDGLDQAGLLNKNRGRDADRWVKDDDGNYVIPDTVDPTESLLPTSHL